MQFAWIVNGLILLVNNINIKYFVAQNIDDNPKYQIKMYIIIMENKILIEFRAHNKQGRIQYFSLFMSKVNCNVFLIQVF